AVGTFLRAYHLGDECFDHDELYAVRIQGASLQSLGALIGRTAFHEIHPPLSNVPFLYWTAFFGTDEAVVRILPLLLGLLAIVLTYCVGRRIGTPSVALLGAALLALNPLHIAYSREARPYAMLVALTAAAHLCFLRSLQLGRPRDRLAYFVVSLLA